MGNVAVMCFAVLTFQQAGKHGSMFGNSRIEALRVGFRASKANLDLMVNKINKIHDKGRKCDCSTYSGGRVWFRARGVQLLLFGRFVSKTLSWKYWASRVTPSNSYFAG